MLNVLIQFDGNHKPEFTKTFKSKDELRKFVNPLGKFILWDNKFLGLSFSQKSTLDWRLVVFQN